MPSFKSFVLFILLSVILFSTGGYALELSVPGDLNGDGVTDHLDFFLFALSYDPHGRRASAAEDFNQDFEIDQRDLFLALLGRLHRDGALPPIDPDETGDLEGVVLEDVGDALVVIPIVNAKVFILTPTGHRFTTSTNPAGGFLAEDLPAGRASVRVEHPEYHPGFGTVEIRAGDSSHIQIHLAPRLDGSSGLRGKVEGAADPFVDFQQPLAGAVVRVFPIEDGSAIDNQTPAGTPRELAPHQAAFANELGIYEIHSLPSGNYRLVVSAMGYESERRDARLEEGESRVEDFLLFEKQQETGGVFGRVTAATGNSTQPEKLVQGEITPIQSAYVSLEPLWASVPDPPLDGAQPPILPPRAHFWTHTDSEGRYELQGVPAGSYRIAVWAEDYYPEEGELEIVSGERVEMNFELTPIELLFGAVEGTVWGATPESDTPVPLEDALVTLLPPLETLFPAGLSGDASIRPAPFVHSATTDENGRFRFDRVRVGLYDLYARAFGWGIGSTTVEVVEEATAAVEVTIVHTPPPGPSSLDGTVWLQPEGAIAVVLPASGATVTVIPTDFEEHLRPPSPDGSDPGILPPIPHRSTLTDEQGSYRFDSLPPGKVRILVHYPNYRTGEAWVEIPPESETTQDFLLTPLPTGGGKVFGRVMFSPPSIASEPIPIAGAKVLLVELGDDAPPIPVPYPNFGSDDNDPMLQPGAVYATTTDGRGYFEFPLVQAGFYRIVVSADEFQTERREVFVPAGETVALHFDLIPDFGGPGPASLEGMVWVSRTAAGPDGSPEPVVGAMVIVVPLDPNTIFKGPNTEPGDSSILPRYTFTNERGGYRFDSLRAGGWAVTVAANGFLPAAQKIHLKSGEMGVLNFQLTPVPDEDRTGLYGMISQWTPYPTFAPVPVEGAEVSLIPLVQDQVGSPTDVLTTLSDSLGNYRFPTLPPGDYELRVQAEGFQSANGIRVSVRQGERVRRDVVLHPIHVGSGGLQGRVLEVIGPDDSLEGNPIPGATVRLIPDWMAVIAIFPPPDVGFDRITNDAGEYSYEDLPAGGYGVTILKDGFQPTMDRVEIFDGQLHQRDWRLAPHPATPSPNGSEKTAVGVR